MRWLLRFLRLLLLPLRFHPFSLSQDHSFGNLKDVPHGVIESLPFGLAGDSGRGTWFHLVGLYR